MTTPQPSEIFAQILNEYSEIKDPKYRHADPDILNGYLDSLRELKCCAEDIRALQNLFNGIAQTMSRIEKNSCIDHSRNIITERGINKSIHRSGKCM